MTTQILPPGQAECVLVVDGYAVPHITLIKANDNEYSIIVDGRFSKFVHADDIEEWGWLIANAMAVAAGYSCHGKGSRRMNPYAKQVGIIGSISPNDEVGDDSE